MTERKLLTSITIDLGGKEVTLSMEEARTLYAELKEMFGKTASDEIYIPVYVDKFPSRQWPYYLGGTWTPDYTKYTVSDGTTTLTLNCE